MRELLRWRGSVRDVMLRRGSLVREHGVRWRGSAAETMMRADMSVLICAAAMEARWQRADARCCVDIVIRVSTRAQKQDARRVCSGCALEARVSARVHVRQRESQCY